MKKKQGTLGIELSPEEAKEKERRENRLKMHRFVKNSFRKKGGHWTKNLIEYLETNPLVSLPEGVTLDRKEALQVARDAYLAELQDLKTKKEMGG